MFNLSVVNIDIEEMENESDSVIGSRQTIVTKNIVVENIGGLNCPSWKIVIENINFIQKSFTGEFKSMFLSFCVYVFFIW